MHDNGTLARNGKQATGTIQGHFSDSVGTFDETATLNLTCTTCK